MKHVHSLRHRFVLIIAILGLVALGGQVAHASNTQVAPVDSPLLIEASATHQSPELVVVRGQNFTPGGAVYVVLYDQWGMERHETRWVNASSTVYGPNGSQDPAIGFSQGGLIIEIFGAFETVYGPNGSQDPAVGYVPAETGDATFGSLCGSALMIRAYDLQKDAWSDVIDVAPGC